MPPTMSSWKGLEYFRRPQDLPYAEDKEDVVQGACLWGTICNARAGMGRVVPRLRRFTLGDLSVPIRRSTGRKI